MSVLSYELEYRQVLVELAELRGEDAQVAAMQVGDDPRDRSKHFQQYWLSLYARYLRLAGRLSALMDAELQPQKLGDLRTMLDSCIGRALEAKAAVVKNCGDYLLLDELLLDMKLTPDQLEVPLPRYILEDRAEELMARRTLVESLQGHYADTEPEAPVSLAICMPIAKVDPSKALPLAAGATATTTAAAGGTDGRDEKPLSFEEAVRLLQACERGRQARQLVNFQMLLRRQQQYALAFGKEFSTVTGKDKAATIVQSVVLGYLERKRAAHRYMGEKQFLGLAPVASTFSDEERLAAELRADDRKARQRMNVAELRQKTLALESSIKTKEGPKTLEVMLDEVLMFMAYARMESRDGATVEVPSIEEGGTLKLLGRTPQPPGAGSNSGAAGKGRKGSLRSRPLTGMDGSTPAAITMATDAANSNAVGGMQAEASRSAAGPTRRASAAGRRSSVKGRTDGDGSAGGGASAVPPSAFWGTMQEGMERHRTEWGPKFERDYVDGGDLDCRADEEELRRQVLAGPRGVMAELRSTVDKLIAIEVANLKAKLQAEADAKKKGKKKSKAKREPKARKPKLKDPTKGIDLETSMNTAIYENKLQLPPSTVRLCDFVGEENFAASSLDRAIRSPGVDDDLRKKWQRILRGWNDAVGTAMGMSQAEFEALFEVYSRQASWLKEPSAAEIRRAITEYGVLPLGSQVIHDLAPSTKSLLLYGLPGTGKTMLVYALCNESGANFFNLSPANFTTTKGIAKTIQLVFYVARMKAPSVIYIDAIEKIYPGKKMKGLPGPPGGGGKKAKGKKKDLLLARGKKMKKEIVKAVSNILPHERVMLVATTSEPWKLDAAAAATHFAHAVYCPQPDYATRLTLLRLFVRRALSGSPEAGATGDAAATALATATTLAVPGDLPADAYQQLAMLTDGFTTGQLRSLIDRALSAGKVQRVLQHQMTARDFLHALAGMRAPAPWERQLVEYFHGQLPVHMRRANAAEDFKESEEDTKRRKSGSVARASSTKVE